MSKAGVYSCDLVSRTVPWRHAGGIDRYRCEYRVSRDAFRYPSYALRKHVWKRALWGGGGGRGWGKMEKKKEKTLSPVFLQPIQDRGLYRIVAMHIIFTRIGCTLFTCDMYMCRLRHINDLVLSSLKMEGIRLLFSPSTSLFHCCSILSFIYTLISPVQ
jgi:hypothetical protein